MNLEVSGRVGCMFGKLISVALLTSVVAFVVTATGMAQTAKSSAGSGRAETGDAGSGAGGSGKASSTLRVFDPTLIDRTVNPCQDFYQYSCGGWLKKHPLPADQSYYGRFSELYDLNREHLRGILEQSETGSNRTPNEQKIGDEYASCMDVTALNEKGITPLQRVLDQIAALKNFRQLPSLVGVLQRMGVGVFFDMGSSPDYANSTQMIAFYDAGGKGLPERGFYTRADAKSAEIRSEYVAHIAKMLTLAGEPADKSHQDAAAVMAFETKLAEASLTATEERDPQAVNHPSDVATLSRQMTHFSLPDYLKAYGGPASGKINVTQPKFYAAVNELVATTPIETLRAYMRWHVLHSYAATSLPESFEQENWHFYAHILNGAEKQQDRWKTCTSRVDHEMGDALGQVYVARYFPPSDKQRTLDLTLAIEQAMSRDIDSLDWMSAETKAQAKIKLHGVMNKIGYPDKWKSYAKLTIVKDDAAGNQMRVQEFSVARDLAKIGKPVDRSEWEMTPPTVNAYYDPQENNVNFPAGYLQPPFFSSKEDDAANYGDMGSTIGHELTHGFDDEGRQFDASGNLKDWWTKNDEEKFTARAACMVKQYDAIEAVPGVHLNGKLTLGENLADLGGLKLALMAWLLKTEEKHVDMSATMDGYTPEQRFWIAYAQQWCSQTRPEALRTQAETDPHAPDKYRTNTVLQDMPEFGRSFSCKKGDAMVIAEPCSIW